MEGTHIDCGKRITDSLIGRKVEILGYEQSLPKGHRLILGDMATVTLQAIEEEKEINKQTPKTQIHLIDTKTKPTLLNRHPNRFSLSLFPHNTNQSIETDYRSGLGVN